ncbi:substrate-binding periplasmic protein [Chitinimonas lacunae]|uniref:Substrate-binding periplasmic protein n=1 Tax=Chitinimonas lacunae TaxID=1963018 RepID=A0ABV8MKM0_9NEIS
MTIKRTDSKQQNGRFAARRLGMVGLALLLAGPLQAGEAPTLNWCHEDNETYPWILPDKGGLYQVLAKLTASRLGIRVVLHPLPWRRCLLDVRAGRMDGVLGAGFTAERCEVGVYPPGPDCKPDQSRYLYIDRYPLYRYRGSLLQWDGKRLSGYRSAIAAQPGFLAARTLSQHRVPIDESDKEPYQIMRKVAAGMVDAAVLQAPTGDKLLREVSDFSATVERMPIPFLEYPTYLLVSHARYQADPQQARQVWDALVAVRQSAEFKAARIALGYMEAD